MPLQNRVDPRGRLHAVPMRGALMGNRGILHDESRRIVRPWAGKAWISCVLQYKEAHREVFSKGTWSELFFLDEATAFSAGHRPCAYCRRERFAQFKTAWLAANPTRVRSDDPSVKEIDRVLHAERAVRGGGKPTFAAALNALPSGTFFELDNAMHLVWQGRTHCWSFGGYSRSDLPFGSQQVRVLTPASIVRMFEQGFVPQVHASVGPRAP